MFEVAVTGVLTAEVADAIADTLTKSNMPPGMTVVVREVPEKGGRKATRTDIARIGDTLAGAEQLLRMNDRAGTLDELARARRAAYEAAETL